MDNNASGASKTIKRGEPQLSYVHVPWYQDLRFSFAILAAPLFFWNYLRPVVQLFWADAPVHLIPGVPPEVVTFVTGALLLLPCAVLVEQITEYIAHNYRHRHDKASASLRAGLLHATFSNIAFLALTVFTLSSAASSGKSQALDLVRIVQVSIAGSIVVSILFDLGVAIFIGGFNLHRHKGRMNFSKELANQDAELITIAVVVLSLPTLASVLNVSPSFLDPTVYKITRDKVELLSVIVSCILITIYLGYVFWTILRAGDLQGQTTEDVEQDVLRTIYRAVNRLYHKNRLTTRQKNAARMSFYDALATPYGITPTEITASEKEIEEEMDDLDYSLERDDLEEAEEEEKNQAENKRRDELKKPTESRQPALVGVLTLPFRVIFLIIFSPFRLLYAISQYRKQRNQYRMRLAEQRKKLIAKLSPEEQRERWERDVRRWQREQEAHKNILQRLLLRLIADPIAKPMSAQPPVPESPAPIDTPRSYKELHHEPAMHVLRRWVAFAVGIVGVVYISDVMAHSIESGLVEGLKLNPFFVGFIILPIASGLVDISAATSKAWKNDVQNALAITSGSAVQSAMLVGPLILLLSRIPLFNLSDINLVFGLFILAVFGLIAYFYQIMTVDGETTWFEGLQLLGIFVAIAVVVFFAGPVMVGQ